MTTAIVGRIGSGKTYTAKGLVETKLHAGERVCIIDPTGVWWGTRLMADGAPGFPVVIFGGDHADIPIDKAQGESLADLIISGQVPQSVVDIANMSGNEQMRFLTDLFERLFQKNRHPLNLVMDEADAYAPQNPMPEQMRVKGAVNKIVRRGRVKGFRTIMITQRPAVLDKSVLSQIDTLIAMRLMSPHDRKAIEEWVKGNADAEQAKPMLASLASLARGEGWVYAPAEGILERRQFPAIATFDSSRTPEPGEERREIVPLKNIELAELRRLFAPAQIETKSAGGAGAPAAQIETIKHEWYGKGFDEGEKRGTAKGIAIGIARARMAIDALRVDEIAAAPPLEPLNSGATAAPAPRQPVPAQSSPPATDRKLGAERRILAVLASCHPAGMTESQWAVASGLKRSGGTWSTYVSRLRTTARAERRGDLWFATDAGLANVGSAVVPLPAPGLPRVEYWIERISGVGPMLRTLAEAYPNHLNRTDMAAHLGLAATGGTFGTYLSRLRSAGLVIADGQAVRAHPDLMEGK